MLNWSSLQACCGKAWPLCAPHHLFLVPDAFFQLLPPQNLRPKWSSPFISLAWLTPICHSNPRSQFLTLLQWLLFLTWFSLGQIPMHDFIEAGTAHSEYYLCLPPNSRASSMMARIFFFFTLTIKSLVPTIMSVTGSCFQNKHFFLNTILRATKLESILCGTPPPTPRPE